MQIAIADNCSLKFTREIKAHWEQKGHEVKYEVGASEFLAQWADVYFVDWWDNNIHYLYKLYHGLHDEMPQNWDNTKKPKIVVRAIDWDIWTGGIRSQKLVDFVDHIICVAPHMEEHLRKEKDDETGLSIDYNGKLVMIPLGVDTTKFPLKTRDTDGFQIGMVLGDMWWYKNHMAGLDIFTTLAQYDHRFRLHIRGQHEGGQYNPVMFEHYLKSRGIQDKVTLYAHTDHMSEWYEQIDYLLHPGMKETFCYAVAEALSKGIKPVVNNFYGAEKIWRSDLLYNTHQEAVQMIFGLTNRIFYDSSKYRAYALEKDITKMLDKYDELLHL